MSRTPMLSAAWLRMVAIVFVVAGIATANESGVSEDTSAEVATLIEQLGSDDYPEREQATRKLIELGVDALPAVEAALEHDDPEVRFRAASIARQLLPMIKKQLLDRFLHGDDAALALSGWKRFREEFGDDPNAREFFAEMYTYGRYRLELLDEGKVHIPADRIPGEPYVDEDDQDLLEHPELTRRPKVNNQVQPNKAKNGLPLGWIATRIFIAAEPECEENVALQREALAACFEPAWWEALENEEQADLVRKLTARLVPLLADDRPIVLALGARFGIRETLPFALDAVREEKGKQAYFALFPIAAFGDKSHLPLVEPLLTDARNAITNNNDSMEIEVRDAALATILILNKQPLRDFFPKRKKDLPDDMLETLGTPAAIGFSNEVQRETTFKKWYAANGREAPKMERRKRERVEQVDDFEEDEGEPVDPFK